MLHRDEDLALRVEALERRADNLEDAMLETTEAVKRLTEFFMDLMIEAVKD
ncbi:MAG: hypothetical protein IJ667_13555 [Synergistaceae bacterium]|nr:hypothetical protein [Synergistaceae bacterium]